MSVLEVLSKERKTVDDLNQGFLLLLEARKTTGDQNFNNKCILIWNMLKFLFVGIVKVLKLYKTDLTFVWRLWLGRGAIVHVPVRSFECMCYFCIGLENISYQNTIAQTYSPNLEGRCTKSSLQAVIAWPYCAQHWSRRSYLNQIVKYYTKTIFLK